MDPQIRPATPADAPFLAWVIQEAARSHLPFGIWDLAFPGSDGQRLERLAAFAVAEGRDVNAELVCGVENGGAFGDLDLAIVDA